MAFFGMDERYAATEAEKMRHSGAARIVCRRDEPSQDHYLFHQIRPEDVVFIKKFTAGNGLYILAAGLVLPGCLIEENGASYLPVEWLWRGRQHTVDPDDTYPFRGHSIYEEFDLAVQREVMDLLPASGHDPFVMVMAAGRRAGTETQGLKELHTGLENGDLPYPINPNT